MTLLEELKPMVVSISNYKSSPDVISPCISKIYNRIHHKVPDFVAAKDAFMNLGLLDHLLYWVLLKVKKANSALSEVCFRHPQAASYVASHPGYLKFVRQVILILSLFLCFFF